MDIKDLYRYGLETRTPVVRDDSAGSYGETINPEGQSTLGWLAMKGQDVAGGAGNLLVNLAQGFSPIGTSEQGNMALQVPPIVSGIAESYGRLAGTPNNPGNAYNLTGVPELDAPIQQDMSNVLLSLYGGNALNPLAKAPAGSVGMFAGRSAKTADHAALARAEEMAGQGVPREQIWNDTGWFQGPDKQWRFEIDDAAASVKNGSGFGVVDGPIQHPELAKNYDFAGLKIEVGKNGGGNYYSRESSGDNTVRVEGGFGKRPSALHEMQHAVQDKEGWLLPPKEGASIADYYNSAPEIDARAVQYRSTLSPDDRANLPPWLLPDGYLPRGKTLFSDTGKPSILGSAMAGSSADLSSPAASAITQPLAMDHASRMGRAREMGFDTPAVSADRLNPLSALYDLLY